jgi:hypothetical protein
MLKCKVCRQPEEDADMQGKPAAGVTLPAELYLTGKKGVVLWENILIKHMSQLTA